MNDEHEVELSESEIRALRSLHADRLPPRGLEDRVVSALRKRGLLRGGAGFSRRWLLAGAAVAATLLLFLAGVAVGTRFPSPPPRAAGERFVLFLYEGEDFQAPAAGTERQRVAEYREWARRLAETANVVAGEKLKDGEQILGPPAAPATVRGPN